ncbi:leucine-rich repeat transmembrane protein kinase family protein [Artemisia annua]|uniref:Leucine-rich repeat transmembrane protein kinase family protein n=1 Tax=Artemisia annua TaxID=35608 RepID=A0A2U1LZB7_ARTAN|nr:leucine-rich repeat transmembrane protein kinase family protein [Artemisia annua]
MYVWYRHLLKPYGPTLLMYDYMPNGSLGSVLHENNGCRLEWNLRYKKLLGSTQGLAYLHHDCQPSIVHRDIKANNTLIGLDFEPYIADFGLAKLLDDRDFARFSSTVPVLTGKQPIDPTIEDRLHIVDWAEVNEARPDPEIEEMMQTLGVALLCVVPAPDDRPSMKYIEAMLKELRLDREEGLKPVSKLTLKEVAVVMRIRRRSKGGGGGMKQVDLWRNGSASDSRSEGCVFDSRQDVKPIDI